MCKITLLCTVIILGSFCILAAQIPPGQGAGSRIQEYQEQKKQEDIVSELKTPKLQKPSLNEAEIVNLPAGGASVYIKSIILQAAEQISPKVDLKKLMELAQTYQQKDLSLENLKEVAAKITQAIGSADIRAYVPQQDFAGGLMYLNIVEANKGSDAK